MDRMFPDMVELLYNVDKIHRAYLATMSNSMFTFIMPDKFLEKMVEHIQNENKDSHPSKKRHRNKSHTTSVFDGSTDVDTSSSCNSSSYSQASNFDFCYSPSSNSSRFLSTQILE